MAKTRTQKKIQKIQRKKMNHPARRLNWWNTTNKLILFLYALSQTLPAPL